MAKLYFHLKYKYDCLLEYDVKLFEYAVKLHEEYEQIRTSSCKLAEDNVQLYDRVVMLEEQNQQLLKERANLLGELICGKEKQRLLQD